MTVPVMHEASVAPISAFKDTLIKSGFLSGDIALMPDTNIPTEEKLANPHNPYKVINLALSESNPS